MTSSPQLLEASRAVTPSIASDVLLIQFTSCGGHLQPRLPLFGIYNYPQTWTCSKRAGFLPAFYVAHLYFGVRYAFR